MPTHRSCLGSKSKAQKHLEMYTGHCNTYQKLKDEYLFGYEIVEQFFVKSPLFFFLALLLIR